MKKIILTLLSLAFAVSAFAQTGKVSFSLIDSQTKQGVMGAVVEVYPTAKPDNKKYYTSGANGYVSISGLSYGNYTLVATFIGYKDAIKEFRLSGESLSLGKLVMTEQAERIETVVKTVKALRTSQNGDTLSYSAGAFKVSNDADVEGLLKKMPGITITNGAVEAQGETIQKIFVDGKEFFGEDVSTAIKSLPAEAVDRIEVFNKLSDQAEFSGMDDGEGYKAINIVTKEGMRQGQFGKMYAGVGYEPDWKKNNAEDFAKGHKWIAGGNVNFFQGDARVSLIGLFNNVNQQNFSFEDILGVSGQQGGGGRGRRGAVGQYMVRPQSGIALVNSIGANYSDEWGRRKNVKFQGSLFFNHTDTDNNSRTEKWYEAPMPIGYMEQLGVSNTINYNARFNARLDWKISRSASLMSRTSFSYQGNNPWSSTEGYTTGENEDAEELEDSRHQSLAYTNSNNASHLNAFRFNEFLQLRTKLGKPGRTLTIDGRINYQNNERKQYTAANEANGIRYDKAEGSDYQNAYNDYFGEGKLWENMVNNPLLYSPLYQYIHRPSEEYRISANVTYNEPVSQYAQVSLQYRMWYENEMNDKRTYYTDSNYSFNPLTDKNENMSQKYQSGFWTHRIGPGFRYAKNKNTVVINLQYQRDILDGSIVGTQGDKIDKVYNHFSYFGMANVAFNRENTLRIFLRSWSSNPSVTQLQSIFDVSNPQYISIGNKNLDPSFTHNLSMHYNLSKVDKGITFMWMFNAQYQQDYISTSTWNNPQGFDLPDKFGDLTIPTRKDKDGNIQPYSPKEVTSYENLDGYYWVRTHVSLGVPLSFMKCNLNIHGGVTYNRTPSAYYLGSTSEEFLENMINTEKPDSERFATNYANNIGYDAGVTLGSNISENLDFTLSWRGTYNQAWNTIGQTAKNDYFNHSANGNIKWTFLKRLTLTAAVSYVQYKGISTNYNEDYVLCNVYLGCKVFKNKRGEVQIGVNDIFDQNTSFVRSTGSGYTQNAWNSCIGRYFSVQFVYNLRHFGKKGSTKMSDYNYKESTGSVGVNRGTSSGGWWGPRR